jgi:hypothetical protein
VLILDEESVVEIYNDFKDIDPELGEIMVRCLCENPHEEDLESLRAKMVENPEMYSMVFDMARTIEDRIINNSFLQPVMEIGIQANTEQIRVEMGYDDAPIFERLLIDNLINCWLRLQWVELFQIEALYSEGDKKPNFNDWEKRLTSTQGRFLKACGTYVRYKSLILKIPALQFNFATDKG